MITITKLWDNIKRDVKYDKYQVSLIAYRNSGEFWCRPAKMWYQKFKKLDEE